MSKNSPEGVNQYTCIVTIMYYFVEKGSLYPMEGQFLQVVLEEGVNI